MGLDPDFYNKRVKRKKAEKAYVPLFDIKPSPPVPKISSSKYEDAQCNICVVCWWDRMTTGLFHNVFAYFGEVSLFPIALGQRKRTEIDDTQYFDHFDPMKFRLYLLT